VFAREIPKKMRAKALFVALSQKMRDGELLFVDSFGLSAPKTADAKKALVALAGVKGFEKLAGTKKHNLALIASNAKTDASAKSFRNISSVSFENVSNLNPVSVLKFKYLVIENPAESVQAIAKRAAKTKLEKASKK
jgi:large subunit ribosomal protein L4